MRFTLDIETVTPGRSYRARVETEGFSLALARPTASEAIARVGQVVEDVLPILEAAEPSALVIEPSVDLTPPVTEKSVAVDGDSDNMRDLLRDAIDAGQDVRIVYTDRYDNLTTRVVTPKAVEWRGSGDAPRMALKADDDGVPGKTFYLDKISRAEAI